MGAAMEMLGLTSTFRPKSSPKKFWGGYNILMYRCHYCQEVKPRDAFPASAKKCWRCNECLTSFLKSKAKEYDAARRAREKARAAIDPAYAEMLRERSRRKEKNRSAAYIERQNERRRIKGLLVGPSKPKWAYAGSREDSEGRLRCSCCKKVLPRGNFNKKGERRYSRCKPCEKPYKAAKAHNRRAKMKGRFSGRDVERLLTTQRGMCVLCRKPLEYVGYHVDHIIPVSKGGSNTKENLQLLCPPCNLSKSDKIEGQINRRPRT